ncbi:hypothetical protein RQP53_05045 [Paucibacter sp. APW11]|uniref:SRPBCC family protein n=1 Tax=Roseateles aquae TaxID=3077235 RepID=A0ABU3P7V1_9BURK|nr:hypothetical protein [Paucibacter sp. APW11]MDT8998634.1 hypothetical protein [Paucibacter sp. APW11]
MELDIPGVKLIETFPKQHFLAQCTELTHAVYPHDRIYGDYCTVQAHIDAPAEAVFRYLARTESLQEWRYALRQPRLHRAPDLYSFVDLLGEPGETRRYCRAVSHAQAMTVDFHTAWDQADELWMVDLMRVVPSSSVLARPGCVVLWTHCHHPNYLRNPYPETAVAERRFWIGDAWPFAYAAHTVELANLKAIAEHRHLLGRLAYPCVLDAACAA